MILRRHASLVYIFFLLNIRIVIFYKSALLCITLITLYYLLFKMAGYGYGGFGGGGYGGYGGGNIQQEFEQERIGYGPQGYVVVVVVVLSSALMNLYVPFVAVSDSMNKKWRSIGTRTLGRRLSYAKTNSYRWVVGAMEVDTADMEADTVDTVDMEVDSDNGVVMAIDSSKQDILILLTFFLFSILYFIVLYSDSHV